jgi:hypothetical protein
MKNLIAIITTLTLLVCITSTARAEDKQLILPIAAAMNTPAAKQKLHGSVKFYFANQPHPNVLQILDTSFSNRKTNALNKTDAQACNWVFLSAMIAMQKHAQDIGANAVINITSYYRKNVMASPVNFECRVGSIVAGVALKGDFVRIAK